MKKLFTLLFISTLFISCSQDGEVVGIEESNSLDFNSKFERGDYDNVNLGIYKGLITTTNSEMRATVHLTLNGKSAPVVEFGYPSGTKEVVRSTEKTTKGQNINKMSFEEGDFKFNFSVNEDGSNPVMSDITYKGMPADAIMAKETSKAPVETKTGSYICETGCFDDAEDETPHPELGAPGAVQTFNYMLTNAAVGSSDIIVQYVLNSRSYTGTAIQQNCAPFDGPGDYIRCGMFAQPDLQGNSGPIRFRSLLSDTASQGNHVFRKDGDAYSCSSYYGTGYYVSSVFGRATVSFNTDQALTDGGDCFNF